MHLLLKEEQTAAYTVEIWKRFRKWGGIPVSYTHLNVILTDTELSELKAELPDKWEYYIDRLSGYIASTGRKYKNHAATIRRWVADDTAKALSLIHILCL